MLIRKIRLLSGLMLVFTASIVAMQPPISTKIPADEFVGAASAGNLRGVQYWLKQNVPINIKSTKDNRTALGAAARTGQYDVVKFLLDLKASLDIPDALGLTPLAWAATQLNKAKPGMREKYEKIVKVLLDKGANVLARDNNGVTILHKAAGGGNPEIIRFLLASGAAADINAEGSKEKGRTPIGEALRASQDALVHVQEFEAKDFATAAELEHALVEALHKLNEKVENKLSTDEIVASIALLRREGAESNVVDALGNKLDCYINEVHLISESERRALLKALGLPDTGRVIRYTEKDLPMAIERLKILDGLLQQFGVGNKVQIIIWTIQAAQKEHDPVRKYSILRLALALISKLKEETKEKVQDVQFSKDIERSINDIRVILRDAALVVSGKVLLSDVRPIRAVPAIAVPAGAVPAAPIPLPFPVRPAPAVSPAPQLVKPIRPAVPVAKPVSPMRPELIENAGRGDLAMVNALLETGADVNEVDARGGTALMEAILEHQRAVIQRLLGHPRLAINQMNNYGMNALLMAAMEGDPDIISALLAKGAMVDVRNSFGATPLMLAAGSGHLEAVRRLLAAGAQPRATDNSGDTALQHALKHPKPNLQAILTLLRQSSAQQAYAPGVQPGYQP